MSLVELKREVAALSPAEQAELVAYINDQLQPDDPLTGVSWREFSTIRIGATGFVGMTRNARLRSVISATLVRH